MSGYEVELSPKANDRLRELPDSLRRQAVDHLYALAESPVKLSRPSAPPSELPGYQIYEFSIVHDGELNWIKFLFKYASDETTLWIFSIARIIYQTADDDDEDEEDDSPA